MSMLHNGIFSRFLTLLTFLATWSLMSGALGVLFTGGGGGIKELPGCTEPEGTAIGMVAHRYLKPAKAK